MFKSSMFSRSLMCCKLQPVSSRLRSASGRYDSSRECAFLRSLGLDDTQHEVVFPIVGGPEPAALAGLPRPDAERRPARHQGRTEARSAAAAGPRHGRRVGRRWRPAAAGGSLGLRAALARPRPRSTRLRDCSRRAGLTPPRPWRAPRRPPPRASRSAPGPGGGLRKRFRFKRQRRESAGAAARGRRGGGGNGEGGFRPSALHAKVGSVRPGGGSAPAPPRPGAAPSRCPGSRSGPECGRAAVTRRPPAARGTFFSLRDESGCGARGA